MKACNLWSSRESLPAYGLTAQNVLINLNFAEGTYLYSTISKNCIVIIAKLKRFTVKYNKMNSLK